MENSAIAEHDSLYQVLFTLSKVVIDKTLECKLHGKLIAIPYEYVPVKEMDYQMGMASYYFDWEKIEFFDYYEWRSEDLVKFLDNDIGALPEFEVASREIMNRYNIDEHYAKKGALHSLLTTIVQEVPNGNINYENVDYYISLLINDFECAKNNLPLKWNIHLWLEKIYIESDSIEIAHEVFLKRPTKEQLAVVRQKSHHISEREQMFGRSLQSGAILSFSLDIDSKPEFGLYPKEITEHIETWLNYFRLFKPCNVAVIFQKVIPESIWEHPISENKERPYDKFWIGKVEHTDTSSYTLYLQKTEEELFTNFVIDLNPALQGITHTSYLKGNSYDLALHRYSDALLKTEVNAYKVLSAITSIEALFSDGGTEITFKIRLRVAKLLSMFGLNAIEISNNMKDAYNLRSKLVHGAKPEDNKKDLIEFARLNTHKIVNYNRVCLLVSLQLKAYADKAKLIKLMDNSLIDPATNDELTKLIRDRVKIPIVYPFFDRTES